MSALDLSEVIKNMEKLTHAPRYNCSRIDRPFKHFFESKPDVKMHQMEDGTFLARIEMLGYDKEDISLDLKNQFLYVSAKKEDKTFGDQTYQQEFSIPEDVEIVKTYLKHGYLYIVTKRDEAKVRKIMIE